MTACGQLRGLVGRLAILVATAAVHACGGGPGAELPTGASAPAAGDDPEESAAANAQPDTTALPPGDVDTLFSSMTSGIGEPRRVVIRSLGAWRGAWAELNGLVAPTPPLPGVDFAVRQVLLLALGERPTGGHTIEVRGVSVVGDTLVVAVRESAPGTGCLTTQVVTRPAIAVGVPLVDGTVSFVEEVVAFDCS